MVPLTAHLRRLRPLASTLRRGVPRGARPRRRRVAVAFLLVGTRWSCRRRPGRPLPRPRRPRLGSAPWRPDAVVVAPHDFTSGDDLIATLSADGVQPVVVYLPRTSLAHVSPAAAARLRSLGFTVAAGPRGAACRRRRAAAARVALNSLADRAAAAAAGDRAVIPAGLQSLGQRSQAARTPPAPRARRRSPVSTPPAILGHLGMLPNADPAGRVRGRLGRRQHHLSAEHARPAGRAPPRTGRRQIQTPRFDQRRSPVPRSHRRAGLHRRQGLDGTGLVGGSAIRRPHLTFVIPAAGTTFAPQQVPFSGATVNGKTVDEPIDVPSPGRSGLAAPDHAVAGLPREHQRRHAAARDGLRQRAAHRQRHRLGVHALLRRQPRHGRPARSPTAPSPTPSTCSVPTP